MHLVHQPTNVQISSVLNAILAHFPMTPYYLRCTFTSADSLVVLDAPIDLLPNLNMFQLVATQNI